MGVSSQRHAPAALSPGKTPGTHCAGGLVGLRAGLDGCGKSRPSPGLDSRSVQHVASRVPTELYWPTFVIPSSYVS
jgi:hypothetical protein